MHFIILHTLTHTHMYNILHTSGLIIVQFFYRMHKNYLERIYQGKSKSVQWLMGEHNRLFADWFEKKVSYSASFVVSLYINMIASKLLTLSIMLAGEFGSNGKWSRSCF